VSLALIVPRGAGKGAEPETVEQRIKLRRHQEIERAAATNPATTNPQHVNYPLPYLPPKPAEVVQVLDRYMTRLEAGAPARFVDSKTHEPSHRPVQAGETRRSTPGRREKFGSYSYPMA
jgi:hypothetical protein